MKLNKKVIESMVVLCSLCVMAITAVTNGGYVGGYVMAANESEVGNTGLEKNGVAGVATALMDYQLQTAKKLDSIVYVAKTNVDVVTATAAEAAQPELTPEEQEWQNYLMSTVTDDNLNVRAEANQESDVVGKLRKGDLATIVEKGSDWTKITSGNVSGYVSNQFAVMGTEALNFAKTNCETIATSTTDSLNVRVEPNMNAEVTTQLGMNDTLVVNTGATPVDGWVAVWSGSETHYVASEFVTVGLQLGTGITMEEETAQIAAAEAAKKAAAEKAAKAKASQSSSKGTSYGSSLAASADDVTLLAALVQCESGSYEGQLAVAAVVCNRVKSGSFPSTVYGVIYQSGQFTPAASGAVERVLAKGPNATAIDAANAALSGQDNTGGCHFFRSNRGQAGYLIGGNVFY